MPSRVDQVREQIRSRLTSFSPNVPIPPERVLVEEFAVSRTTLRKAMQSLVDEGYIHRYAGRGTFVADTTQGTPTPAEPLTIGLIMPRFYDIRGNSWIEVIIDHLYRENTSAIFGLSRSDPFRELETLRQMVRRRAKGLLLWPCHELLDSPTLRRQIEGLGIGTTIPCVTLGHSPLYPEATPVWFDEVEAGRIATRHLIEQGHKRIAHVSYARHIDIANRTRGYHEAMAAAGLPIPQGYEIDISNVPHSDVSLEMGRNVARLLLALPEPPTAVFAYWTEIAAGILVEARHRGLRISDDMAVIGVGTHLLSNTPEIAGMDVSSIWYDMEGAANQAVQILLQQIAGGPRTPALHVRTELRAAASSVRSDRCPSSARQQ